MRSLLVSTAIRNPTSSSSRRARGDNRALQLTEEKMKAGALWPEELDVVPFSVWANTLRTTLTLASVDFCGRATTTTDRLLLSILTRIVKFYFIEGAILGRRVSLSGELVL